MNIFLFFLIFCTKCRRTFVNFAEKVPACKSARPGLNRNDVILLLALIFLFNQEFTAVHFAELWLFNFTGCISGNRCKNDLPRPFIPRHTQAEVIDFLFCAGLSLLDFYNCSGNFAQPLIRQADYGNILDLIKLAHKVFDLNRVDIFTAADNHVFLAVYQEIEAPT